MGPVLVFGHKNPDNDSICSAVAYAHLKNLTDQHDVYVPARLGPVPPETAWVFGRFGVELPEEIAHVHTRVRDVMTGEVVTVDADKTMLEAGRLMRDNNIRALPVMDGDAVKGLVNVSILAERYLDETEIRGFARVPVTVGSLVHVLDGELATGDASAKLAGGVRIGAMEPTTLLEYIEPGDTLIVGDRKRTQPMALDAGAACLVITGGSQPDAEVLARAKELGAAVITTAHDTFAAARLMNLSTSVRDAMDPAVPYVELDTLLAEASEDLLASAHREAIVVDPRGHLAGILTRTNIARGQRRKVVLVDHNEIAQSAPGVANASVVEIVDHHRVGDVQTTGPIMFLNMPVGSTATIVARRYEELGVEPPEAMAGLLLSAVLTDTVLLKSPTTTDTDRDVAARLAGIVGVDAVEFGMEMFRARTAGLAFSAERTVTADLKEYRIGEVVAAIGQVETVERDKIMSHADELRAVMDTLRENRGYDLVLLMVTDIVAEGSSIIAVGKTRLAERGLGVSLASGSAWMDGVLSRKKQVAARLVDAASG